MKLEKFKSAAGEMFGSFSAFIRKNLEDNPEFDIDEPVLFLCFELEGTDEVAYQPMPRLFFQDVYQQVAMVRKLVNATDIPEECLSFTDKTTGDVRKAVLPISAVMHWAGGYVKDTKGNRTGEENFMFYVEDRDGNAAIASYKKTPDGATHSLEEHMPLSFSKLTPDMCGEMQNFFDAPVTSEVAN